jgi:aquaporin Z
LIGAALAALIVQWFKGDYTVTPLERNVGAAMSADFPFTFALVYVVLNAATARATRGTHTMVSPSALP